jgi:hypothetical protein
MEPSDDDQHREGDETDGASIGWHLNLTAVRIGRLGWHCARPQGPSAHAIAFILRGVYPNEMKYALKLIVKSRIFEVNLLIVCERP